MMDTERHDFFGLKNLYMTAIMGLRVRSKMSPFLRNCRQIVLWQESIHMGSMGWLKTVFLKSR